MNKTIQLTKDQGERKRVEWIDQMRGILFFLVIISHTKGAPYWLQYIYEPIFLPGFFFLSGYLFRSRSYGVHLKSIFNGLFMPYLIYSIIISCYTVIYSPPPCMSIFTSSFYETFLLGGDSIWFIPCLIILEFLFFTLYYKLRIDDMPKMLLLWVAVVIFFFIYERNVSKSHMPWNIDTAIYCMGYYIFGHFCKQKSIQIGLKTAVAFCLFYFIIAIACGFLLNGMFVGEHRIFYDIHTNNIQNAMTYLLLSYIGVFAIFLLLMHLPSFKPFVKLGQVTLFAFPFHGYVLRAFSKFVDNYLIVSVLVMTTMVFAGMIIYKYLPCLAGKYKYLK